MGAEAIDVAHKQPLHSYTVIDKMAILSGSGSPGQVWGRGSPSALRGGESVMRAQCRAVEGEVTERSA